MDLKTQKIGNYSLYVNLPRKQFPHLKEGDTVEVIPPHEKPRTSYEAQSETNARLTKIEEEIGKLKKQEPAPTVTYTSQPEVERLIRYAIQQTILELTKKRPQKKELNDTKQTNQPPRKRIE